MEQANETIRQSRHKIRAQLRKLSWLGETQAALGWGVILIIGALVGTLYVSQASRIAERGRTTQRLQFELENIKRENAELEREIAEAQSLELLAERAREEGFVRSLPEDIEFLVVDSYPPDLATPAAATPEATLAPVYPETLGQAIWWSIRSRFSDMARGESRDR
ncbi:MAG: septum formation initiator family protein [Anaerolineales bacterium]|nr:septum formation initiator family protein [Anaerolineales bacterium]MCB0010397.1 septum formation initiator family protein [Anaerolineales bacterium]MCB0018613.1 septum formation initiator family protein [Anaerolineales bacterium]MCB8961662.1 septum formation initiator family protein [Ardenticatenales bacterium]